MFKFRSLYKYRFTPSPGALLNLPGVSIVTSVLTMVLMSVDRYLAIRHPMKNRRIFTLSRVRRLVFMTWLTAAVVVFPIALVNQVSQSVSQSLVSSVGVVVFPIALVNQVSQSVSHWSVVLESWCSL